MDSQKEKKVKKGRIQRIIDMAMHDAKTIELSGKDIDNDIDNDVDNDINNDVDNDINNDHDNMEIVANKDSLKNTDNNQKLDDDIINSIQKSQVWVDSSDFMGCSSKCNNIPILPMKATILQEDENFLSSGNKLYTELLINGNSANNGNVGDVVPPAITDCTHISDSIPDIDDCHYSSIDNFESNPIDVTLKHKMDGTITNNGAVNNNNTILKPSESQPLGCTDISETTVDDDRDKDFDINDYSEENGDGSSIKSNDSEMSVIIYRQFIGLRNANSAYNIQADKKEKKKLVRCRYCDEDIASKNFMRHLTRNHVSEKEVDNIMTLTKNSKLRRQAVASLRNDTNFDLFVGGMTRPKRQRYNKDLHGDEEYYPCIYCKGLFLRKYLRRHAKSCFKQKSPLNAKNSSCKENHLSDSQTLTACAMDPTNTISRLNVNAQVFRVMKADEISFVAKKDLLIANFGESYSKKHRRERMAYACSNRMRELSRLLISYRKIIKDNEVTLKDLLHPKHFENVLSAARDIVGYDAVKKTFKSPSLAMHLGTSLKTICDELRHLILKEANGFHCKTPAAQKLWLYNVKNFKRLIESRWNTELASLANKDMQEKRWNKPLLLPLVSDIQKFRNETLKFANECVKKFSENMLLIVFNRRRIGDVQFLKIENYKSNKKSDYTDFDSVLSETEKVLTKKYKRVLNSGKGSRAVVILIPEILQNFIDVLLKHRTKYIPADNDYIFAIPGSTIKWGKGDVAIRTLADKMKLENSQSISSNRLRKQIATVMQILNLSQDETKQFSNFMGHTQKTHDEFYELPVDIYQTAKISKLLLMMEKGAVPVEYKGKSLAEIDIDPNSHYAEENDIIKDEGVIILNSGNVENSAAGEIEMEEDKIIGDESFDEDDDVVLSKLANPLKDQVVNTKEGLSCKNKKGPNTLRKKGWTDREVSLIQKKFNKYINSGTYPSGSEVKEFIEEFGMSRSVLVIKSKIQHLIKLSKK